MRNALLSLVLAIHGAVYPPPPQPRWGAGPHPAAPGPRGPDGPARPGPLPTGPAGPGGPMSPRPPMPPLPPLLTPSAPVTPAADDLARAGWREWWSFNHDALLDVRARVAAVSARSGENRASAERRALQAKLAPVLVAQLEGGERDQVLRQSLVACARLARTEHAVPLERSVRWHLSLPNPQVHDAALIALGLEAQPFSLELLRHVLMDDEAGRAVVHGEGPLPLRLRAVAAYAIGLAGQRAANEDARRTAVHALLFALGNASGADHELQVACVLALGLVPIAPCTTPEEALDPARRIEELHLCGGAQADYLLAIVRDAGQDAALRGHAAAALGRLAAAAGPGAPATDDHPEVASRAVLVDALCEALRDARKVPELRQGALLGLGAVADSDGDAADRAARKRIVEELGGGEPLARAFALVALAETLGRPGAGERADEGWKDGSALLLRELSRVRGERLAWTALALGVAAHGRALAGLPASEGVAGALRQTLARAKEDEVAAASALALAVARVSDPLAHSALRAAFAEHANAGVRASVALALGLLAAPDASSALAGARAADGTTPLEGLALATGLRLLGDTGVVAELTGRLAASPPLPEALSIVRSLAFLQDPACGDALLALLAKKGVDERLRAALVWCLGALADPTAPDWTAAYANGLAYGFAPEVLASPLGDGRGVLDWR